MADDTKKTHARVLYEAGVAYWSTGPVDPPALAPWAHVEQLDHEYWEAMAAGLIAHIREDVLNMAMLWLTEMQAVDSLVRLRSPSWRAQFEQDLSNLLDGPC